MTTQLLQAKRPDAGTIHWLNDCIKRADAGVFSEVITLTPGLAGELLRRNPENRSLRDVKVRQFVQDIRDGRWVFNGEPFLISKEGLLNDGQHRANAIVEANVPITAILTFGVERDSRYTVDQGGARTASDYLSMQSIQNATVQASIARQVIGYERSEGKSLKPSQFATNAEILQRVYTDPKIGDAAHFAAGHRKGSKLFAAPAIIGFCFYVLSEIDADAGRKFMTQVCNGEGLRQKDPAYTIRDRLLSAGRVGAEMKAHIIFRGWNAFRQNRTLAIAKVFDTGLPGLI